MSEDEPPRKKVKLTKQDKLVKQFHKQQHQDEDDIDITIDYCERCRLYYNCKNRHNCKGFRDKTLEQSIRCSKQYLSAGIINPTLKPKVLELTETLTHYHHRIKWIASRLLLGYILHNQGEDITITQQTCYQAISVCSPKSSIKDGPIQEYYENHFKHLLPITLKTERKAIAGLSRDVYQYTALQMFTDWKNMMQKLTEKKSYLYLKLYFLLLHPHFPIQICKRLEHQLKLCVFNSSVLPKREKLAPMGDDLWENLNKNLFPKLEEYYHPILNCTEKELAGRQLYWLYYLQKWILKIKEENPDLNFRFHKFTYFPLPGFVPTQFQMNNSALDACKMDCTMEDLFDPSKFRKDKFCSRFTTDGVAISYMFNVQKPKSKSSSEAPKGRYVHQYSREEFSKFDGILTIDTNRRNLFVGTYVTKEELAGLELQKRIKYKKVGISGKEWLDIRGVKRMYQSEQRIDNKHKEKLLCYKGVSKSDFVLAMQTIDEHLVYMFDLYSSKGIRRKKMESYQLGQKAYKKAMDKIFTQLKVAKAKTLIVLGDGCFSPNSAGHPTMPSGVRLYKECKKMGYHMSLIDEFRTSKCCSLCLNPNMNECLVGKRKSGEDESSVHKPWGLRVCNKNHSREPSGQIVWNRDVNACLCMVRLVGGHFNERESYLTCFKRGITILRPEGKLPIINLFKLTDILDRIS